METVLTVLSAILVFAMVIPATGFPILLSTTDWKDTAVGKSLMLMALSLAALVDVSVVFKLLHIKGGTIALVIQVIVFLMINAGLWSVFLVINKMKRDAKKVKNNRKAVFDGE